VKKNSLAVFTAVFVIFLMGACGRNVLPTEPTAAAAATKTITTTLTIISTANATATAIATDINTYTPTLIPTETPLNTSTYTVTDTNTITSTPTVADTATLTQTDTPTETPLNTSTYTVTDTITDTPTDTDTATHTITVTPTETPQNTSTYTVTDTYTATNTPVDTDTATNTMTPTQTDVPIETPTQTATLGPVTMEFQKGVLPSSAYAGSSDTTINSINGATMIEGGCDYIELMTVAGGYFYGILKFDISAIPPGSTVISAKVELTAYSVGSSVTYNVYPLMKDWLEGVLCFGPSSVFANWSTTGITPWAAPGGLSGIDYSSTSAGNGIIATPAGTKSTINLTLSVVQAWVDSSASNYGLFIKSNSSNYVTVYSKEATTASYRPKLTISYY
jgi:hypothetical protein